ncbi:MAG: glycoside hydrolase [Chloroflexi bacterium]|nr:glycoside hydrolase [Chloroflexota bacterium]
MNVDILDRRPPAPARSTVTCLDGAWELIPTPSFRGNYYSDEQWLTVSVPGHWQQHPQLATYTGKVVYRKRFTLTPEKGKRYRLRLNGVFYFYVAYLNGFRLGENEGYAFGREFDITPHLNARTPDNELLIEVECADESNKSAKRQITGVFSHWDCLDPAANPGGIWQSVEIVETGPVYISDFRLTPVRNDDVIRLADENPPDTLELRADIVANSLAPSAPVYRVTFTPHNFEGKPFSIAWRANCAPGDNTVTRFFKLEHPKLWWTHDLLDPNLYTVRVETFGDELLRSRYDAWEFRWGLRTFEMHDFVPYLNGHRFFLKGNNYPPGDTRMATMTRERYAQDLQLAKDANMNFLRVHGHVEKREFYEVADELGILIWQDFPLQWAYDHCIVPQAERQVQLMINTLYNHPSIGIWCMHNEPIGLVDTSHYNPLALLRAGFSSYIYSWDRNVLDTRLKRVAERVDPTRFVLRASGKWALPWMSDTDSHFYFGWYKTGDGPKRRFETLTRIFPGTLQFATEFGAQSFPNLESAVKFMDADIQKIDWKLMQERYHFQPDQMADWYDWRSARSLPDLIAMSQEYQIDLNQYYVDWLRYHKYRPCGGFAAFVFLDSNPAVQWSLVDYWRVPKRSYDAMKTALNPEYAFAQFKQDAYRAGEAITASIFAVNDSLWSYERVTVAARVLDEAGQTAWQAPDMTTALGPDCLAQHVQDVTFQLARAGSYRLELTLRYGESVLVNSYRVRVL